MLKRNKRYKILLSQTCSIHKIKDEKKRTKGNETEEKKSVLVLLPILF